MAAGTPELGADVVGEPGRTTRRSARLVLREVLPEEAGRLVAGMVGRADWSDGYPLDGTVFAAEGLVEAMRHGAWRPGFGMYEICLRDTGTVIGDVGFKGPPVDGAVEIGYGLVPEHRGNGYATEAVVALTTWVLARPDVTEVVADTAEDNEASQRVLIRAGFTLVRARGTVRDYVLRDGRGENAG